MHYSIEQIVKINQETSNFYALLSDSFSETRQHKWPGWDNCLLTIKKLINNNKSLKILDFGCGNLRFENYLCKNFPSANFEFDCVDNNKMSSDFKFNIKHKINFINLDIVDCLLNQDDFLALSKYDLIVCFGLMHHIPGSSIRQLLFFKLKSLMKKNSIFIVSLWQFEKSKKLMDKATKSTAFAKEKLKLPFLEENDYFLSWEDRNDIFRFCHNFTEKDILDIKNNNDLDIIKDYNCDGGNLQLNKYLIFSNCLDN